MAPSETNTPMKGMRTTGPKADMSCRNDSSSGLERKETHRSFLVARFKFEVVIKCQSGCPEVSGLRSVSMCVMSNSSYAVIKEF